jgi:hypothetical protein
MNQDILLWIPLNIITLLAVHFSFALVGMVIKIMNTKYLTVKSFICAVMFGFFYFLSQVWDLDGVVLDFRKDEKVENLKRLLKKQHEELEVMFNQKKALQLKLDELQELYAAVTKKEPINS